MNDTETFAPYTLAIIKPEVIRSGRLAEVLQEINDKEFRIHCGTYMKLTVDMARVLYAEHEDKPFFKDLIEFTASGPIVVLLLSWVYPGDHVAAWRMEMGATDGSKAHPASIRGKFHVPGAPLRENTVHGSADAAAMRREAALFFSGFELLGQDEPPVAWRSENVKAIKHFLEQLE